MSFKNPIFRPESLASSTQGRRQKFFERGILKVFCMDDSGVARNFSRGGGFSNLLYGKILGGGFSVFFLKNPSKLKNFWVKGGTNSPLY